MDNFFRKQTCDRCGGSLTSERFTSELIERKIKISMDGKGRALDNAKMERFWWVQHLVFCKR